jgi:hypothetical protein
VIQVANSTAVPEGLRLLRAGGQYRITKAVIYPHN